MSEMVEKVAAAIWRAREEDLPPRVRRMDPDELDRTTGAWKHVMMLARAAVEAMGKPSKDMKTEGSAALCSGAACNCCHDPILGQEGRCIGSFTRAYTAAVRAALAP